MKCLSAVLASLVAIAVVGCGDDGGDAPRTTPASSSTAPVVDCRSRSQVIPSGHPGRMPRTVRTTSVFAGPVMFVGAKQWGNDPFKPQPGRLETFKVPIDVEAAHAVTVTVSPPAGRQAVVEIARDRGPTVDARSVELRPCLPSATVASHRVGSITPFLGGFRLDGPMCLDVQVEVEGRTEPIMRTIGFGRRSCR